MGARADLRWAVVGTGFISDQMVAAIRQGRRSRLVAVVGRSAHRVEQFRARHEIPFACTDLTELLGREDVDVVYVGTPTHAHGSVVSQAAAAGKAILSEKALERTLAAGDEIVQDVRRQNTFFVEGLMFLAHPLYGELASRLRSSAFGELVAVRGFYHADIEHLANPLGGGTIYNLGCYPAALLHFVVREMCGDEMFDTRSISATGVMGSGATASVLVEAELEVQFAGGVTAAIGSSDRGSLSYDFEVETSEGLLIWRTNPWLPPPGRTLVEWRPHVGDVEELVVVSNDDIFTHQIRMVEDALAAGSVDAPWPSPSPEDSLRILRLLTEWEAAVTQSRSSPMQ